MEEKLKALLSRIADGSLLPAAYYGRIDRNAAIDARDGDAEFESQWVDQLQEVDRRWASANINEGLRTLAEDIRRESFLAVSHATRQHEIASYVSDDFDLIARGWLAGVEHGLLGRLWAVYDRGEFPRPPM